MTSYGCRVHGMDPCPVCDGCGMPDHRPGATVCLDCPTADIVDVFRDAVRVTFGEVRPGDSVFDTFGRPDRVMRVTSRTTTRGRVRVRIVPRNWWPIVGDDVDTITIVRGALHD